MTRRFPTPRLHVLMSLGCSSYVKTIYVGYDLEGQMVAALYSDSVSVEVALALPENAQAPLVEDASHLKWRTLPVDGSDQLAIGH